MTATPRRGFLVALALSAVLHLGAAISPGWHLPDFSEPEVELIEARLAPPPAPKVVPPQPVPVPQAQPMPTPKPARQPRSEAIPAAPAVEAASSGPSTPAMPAQPVVAPSQPSAPVAVETAWPKKGRIRFGVSRASDAMVLGRTVHDWSHDGRSYTLRDTTESTGVVALFKPVKLVQESRGELTPQGLKPLEWRAEKNGVAGDWVNFDWAAGKVTMTGGREGTTETGMQDMLSLLHQLGLLAGNDRTVPLASGKKIERLAFQRLGEENLPLAGGDKPTLHLKATDSGGEVTEVWLSQDARHLPLKIRRINRKGEIFDQTVEETEFSE
jgi:hypothetical protein